MGDFKALVVWQRSCEAAEGAYLVARQFPVEERFELSSQVRRAAISVSANIAEGSSRYNRRDEARCYRIASSSAAELECLLILAERLRLIPAGEVAKTISLTREVQRMLNALIRACLKDAA